MATLEKEVVKPAVAVEQASKAAPATTGNSPAGAGAQGAPAVVKPVDAGAQGAPAVVKPVDAGAQGASTQVSEAKPEPRWTFVKNFSPAESVTLPDGSKFKFPLIKRNDKTGYAHNSKFSTRDEKLAEGLRAVAKNKALGIVEV